MSLLDFENPEAHEFMEKMINNHFLDSKSTEISSLSKDEKGKLLILFLVQIARYLAPKDNREFLVKLLIHLAKNPLFANFIAVAQLRVIKLTKHSLNLPTLGIFVAPKGSNKYVFAIPHSPKEVYLFFIGNDPSKDYTEEELVELSYGTYHSSVYLHKDNAEVPVSEIIEIQKHNSKKVGNLAKQLEDPQPLLTLIKSVMTNLPGIKGNYFLLKAIDVGMKIFNKK